MRPIALLVDAPTLATSPPPGAWRALVLGTTSWNLVLAEFTDTQSLQDYVALPGVRRLPRTYRPVPALAVQVLGPLFGVVATDTIGDALDKIAATWPEPWLSEHA
jgi:hypothetical protein